MHTGREGYFVRFADSSEPGEKIPDNRIKANGRRGCHEQKPANAATASANVAQSSVLARVMVHRCKTNQCRNLGICQLTEFGQVGKQFVAGLVTNTGNGTNQLVLLTVLLAVFDELFDFLFQRIHFALKHV